MKNRLTVTVAQADEVLKAAEQSRGMFVVVHQKRFEPAYLYVKQLLDSGELGPVVSLLDDRIGMAFRELIIVRARGVERGGAKAVACF